MLQPIAASQNSVSQQAPRQSDVPDAVKREFRTADEAPSRSVDPKIAISGRLNDMMVTSRSSDGLVLLAEMLSRALGSDRKDDETDAHYLRRLSGLLAKLSPQMRVLVEQLLNQRVEGLKLAFVIAALSDPSGPAAARLAARLEGSGAGGPQDPATRSIVTLYQQNNGDGRIPPAPPAAQVTTPAAGHAAPQPAATLSASQAPAPAAGPSSPQAQTPTAPSLTQTAAPAAQATAASPMLAATTEKALTPLPTGPDAAPDFARSVPAADPASERPALTPSTLARPQAGQPATAARPVTVLAVPGDGRNEPRPASSQAAGRLSSGTIASPIAAGGPPPPVAASTAAAPATPLAKAETGAGEAPGEVSSSRAPDASSDKPEKLTVRAAAKPEEGHPILQVLKGWQEITTTPPASLAAKPESALDQLIRSTLGRTGKQEAGSEAVALPAEADKEIDCARNRLAQPAIQPGADGEDSRAMPGKTASHLLNLAASQTMALAEAAGQVTEPDLPTAIPLPVVNYLFAQDEADRYALKGAHEEDEDSEEGEAAADEQEKEPQSKDEEDDGAQAEARDSEVSFDHEETPIAAEATLVADDRATSPKALPAPSGDETGRTPTPIPVQLAGEPASQGPEGLYWRMAGLS
ncbi:hypothetical protein [Rhizobium halophytocola]|uniref:Flagellar hook-length control protein FliK n=1 Tax=Rhizobium halophytocola TaxID=735519 RepID=A0ABS4E133_9HYPH|nr:hypothetical protein [Rhizobium halophytocola]MBP1851650.1 hypothetical protein [Rhizobium halophytocola]